jgi:hypothetical protein
MKRNVPKDVMTVLKFAKLSEDELSEKLKLIERHKRPQIKEMVEFVKTLQPQELIKRPLMVIIHTTNMVLKLEVTELKEIPQLNMINTVPKPALIKQILMGDNFLR